MQPNSANSCVTFVPTREPMPRAGSVSLALIGRFGRRCCTRFGSGAHLTLTNPRVLRRANDRVPFHPAGGHDTRIDAISRPKISVRATLNVSMYSKSLKTARYRPRFFCHAGRDTSGLAWYHGDVQARALSSLRGGGNWPSV